MPLRFPSAGYRRASFMRAGMLVAIPVTAAAQVLLSEWYREYQASQFFEGRER